MTYSEGLLLAKIKKLNYETLTVNLKKKLKTSSKPIMIEVSDYSKVELI